MQVVAFRLRRMAALLGEREASLRGSATYVCPLCRHAVSELEFKLPYCERYYYYTRVESGARQSRDYFSLSHARMPLGPPLVRRLCLGRAVCSLS